MSLGVVVLQGLDVESVGAESLNAFEASFSGGDCGHDRDSMFQCTGPNLNLVGTCDIAGWGIDDEGDLLVFDEVDHVGAPFGKLEKSGAGNTSIGQFAGCSSAGNNFETKFMESLADLDGCLFIAIADAKKDSA